MNQQLTNYTFVIILLGCFAFPGITFGQAGLDGVIIEKYYIADDTDASTSMFPVPAGAVTYRVYVDMADGWELQAVFGSTNSSTGEIDSLIIRSTEPFFNNEDRGRAFGYLINNVNLDENTVLLDSWFSTGRCGTLAESVLKPEDTNGGIPSFPNVDGLLQHDDPEAGLPISTSDGNIPGTSNATWNLIGITPADLLVFDNINLFGNQFIENDGALTNFGTSIHGPNANNRVLIGQFTTAGDFSGQLNVQLRNVSSGVIEQWVAETPAIGQFTSPSLKWAANNAPTVHIVSPIAGSYFQSGQIIHVIANADDTDGSIDHVLFLFNTIPLGIDLNAPFEISFVASMDGFISAEAFDNQGAQSSSFMIPIDVNAYEVQHIEQPCHLEKTCIPIHVFGQGIVNVTGFEIELSFDINKIIPTGEFVKSNDFLDAGYYNVDHLLDVFNGKLFIDLYTNTNAPLGSVFSGNGDLVCVEFQKRPAFEAEDSTYIWIERIQEDLFGGNQSFQDSIPPGQFNTVRNTSFLGSIAFWADHGPMKFDSANPASYVPTWISGNAENCDSISQTQITVDEYGGFVHDLHQGRYLNFERDISDTTDVQSVINSFDAFLLRKFLIDDPEFIPNAYQVIAMDVNLDGVISAGDLSQINQRTLLIIDEFRQVWNYSSTGDPLSGYAPSKDWIFINNNSILFNPAFRKSNAYPGDDGLGYSKFRVPQIPSCIWTEVAWLPFLCTDPFVETYWGVLLGDVNGNYRYIENDGKLK